MIEINATAVFVCVCVCLCTHMGIVRKPLAAKRTRGFQISVTPSMGGILIKLPSNY